MKTKTVEEILLSKIRVDERGCWIWTASLCHRGRGKITLRQAGVLRTFAAARASYTAFVGPIPPGLEVDHRCMVPLCINPQHLEPVTGEENRRRYFETFTHCRAGHPYDELNARVASRRSERTGKQVRVCRACERMRLGRYNARKKAGLV